MVIPIKIVAVGSAFGILLPEECLTRLDVKEGDTVYLGETPYGLQITAQDEGFAQQIEAAEKVMYENRDVLRRLAK